MGRAAGAATVPIGSIAGPKGSGRQRPIAAATMHSQYLKSFFGCELRIASRGERFLAHQMPSFAMERKEEDKC